MNRSAEKKKGKGRVPRVKRRDPKVKRKKRWCRFNKVLGDASDSEDEKTLNTNTTKLEKTSKPTGKSVQKMRSTEMIGGVAETAFAAVPVDQSSTTRAIASTAESVANRSVKGRGEKKAFWTRKLKNKVWKELESSKKFPPFRKGIKIREQLSKEQATVFYERLRYISESQDLTVEDDKNRESYDDCQIIEVKHDTIVIDDDDDTDQENHSSAYDSSSDYTEGKSKSQSANHNASSCTENRSQDVSMSFTTGREESLRAQIINKHLQVQPVTDFTHFVDGIENNSGRSIQVCNPEHENIRKMVHETTDASKSCIENGPDEITSQRIEKSVESLVNISAEATETASTTQPFETPSSVAKVSAAEPMDTSSTEDSRTGKEITKFKEMFKRRLRIIAWRQLNNIMPPSEKRRPSKLSDEYRSIYKEMFNVLKMKYAQRFEMLSVPNAKEIYDSMIFEEEHNLIAKNDSIDQQNHVSSCVENQSQDGAKNSNFASVSDIVPTPTTQCIISTSGREEFNPYVEKGSTRGAIETASTTETVKQASNTEVVEEASTTKAIATPSTTKAIQTASPKNTIKQLAKMRNKKRTERQRKKKLIRNVKISAWRQLGFAEILPPSNDNRTRVERLSAEQLIVYRERVKSLTKKLARRFPRIVWKDQDCDSDDDDDDDCILIEKKNVIIVIDPDDDIDLQNQDSTHDTKIEFTEEKIESATYAHDCSEKQSQNISVNSTISVNDSKSIPPCTPVNVNSLRIVNESVAASKPSTENVSINTDETPRKRVKKSVENLTDLSVDCSIICINETVKDADSNMFFEDTSANPIVYQNDAPIYDTVNSQCVLGDDSDDLELVSSTPITRSKSNRKRKRMDDSVVFISEEPAPLVSILKEGADYVSLVDSTIPDNQRYKERPHKKAKSTQSRGLFTAAESKQMAAYNSNTFNPNTEAPTSSKRMVIIDGCNVAYSHSRNKEFSVRGIEILIEYFKQMGHEVKVVIPQIRMKKSKSTDQSLLEKLHDEGYIVLTPCKSLPGKSSVSYDDRFILQLAVQFDAAIISNDQYRDLLHENPTFKKVIESRVIGYTWCNDVFILATDPYGRHGPKLNSILNRK